MKRTLIKVNFTCFCLFAKLFYTKRFWDENINSLTICIRIVIRPSSILNNIICTFWFECYDILRKCILMFWLDLSILRTDAFIYWRVRETDWSKVLHEFNCLKKTQPVVYLYQEAFESREVLKHIFPRNAWPPV